MFTVSHCALNVEFPFKSHILRLAFNTVIVIIIIIVYYAIQAAQEHTYCTHTQ